MLPVIAKEDQGKATYINRLYSSKIRFSRPSLLTRQSTLVLKVGVLKGGEAFKRRLVHSVA